MADVAELPLCVDLDGTLIRTDLLWEGIFGLVRAHPLRAFALPFQLLRGRAAFKQWLAECAPIDVEAIPYRESIVEWVRQQARDGRAVALATASPLAYADKVAQHLGCFRRVFATSGTTNLKGVVKADALVAAYGSAGFDYVGDSRADIPVWRQARIALVVDNGGGLLRRAERALRDAGTSVGATPQPQVVPAPGASAPEAPLWFTWLRALRIHQWLKNVLICVPALAAHRIDDPHVVALMALAFVSFGLVASSAYVFNDLLDLEADRHHPAKRQRPFAAGQLPLAQGAIAGVVLLLAGLALATWRLPSSFTLVLGIYFLCTCAYSSLLKQWAIVDVAALAGLYVVRIIAGAVATDVPISFWLLAFSLFFFFSLALAKRYAELADAKSEETTARRRRGYRAADLPLLQALGIASGFVAILVMAFYINSPESQALYRRAQVLWILIPILLLWISRLWLLAHRRELHEDPVVYALMDRGSLALGAATVATLIVAIR